MKGQNPKSGQTEMFAQGLPPFPAAPLMGMPGLLGLPGFDSIRLEPLPLLPVLVANMRASVSSG